MAVPSLGAMLEVIASPGHRSSVMSGAAAVAESESMRMCVPPCKTTCRCTES